MPSNLVEWTAPSIARELGVDVKTARKRLESVEPVGRRGKARLYRMADAIKAIHGAIEEKETSTETESGARARLTRARADIHSLQAAQLSGELVPVRDVVANWTKIVGQVRGQLISLPDRASPAGFDAKTQNQLRQVLREYVNEILSELADTEVEDSDDGNDGAPEARARSAHGAGSI